MVLPRERYAFRLHSSGLLHPLLRRPVVFRLARFRDAQRHIEHLFHAVDVAERQALDVFGFDVFHVFLVFTAKHYFLDAGAFGRQDFFLDTAHGQHLAAQGD